MRKHGGLVINIVQLKPGAKMCVAKVDRLSEAIDMCHVNTIQINLIDFD